jgi:hypothetical protein
MTLTQEEFERTEREKERLAREKERMEIRRLHEESMKKAERDLRKLSNQQLIMQALGSIIWTHIVSQPPDFQSAEEKALGNVLFDRAWKGH